MRKDSEETTGLTVKREASAKRSGEEREENRGLTGKKCRKLTGGRRGGRDQAEAQRRGPSNRKPLAGRCTWCGGSSWQAPRHGVHLACSCPGCWNWIHSDACSMPTLAGSQTPKSVLPGACLENTLIQSQPPHCSRRASDTMTASGHSDPGLVAERL